MAKAAYCSRCGKANKASADWCSACGNPLDEDDLEDEAQEFDVEDDEPAHPEPDGDEDGAHEHTDGNPEGEHEHDTPEEEGAEAEDDDGPEPVEHEAEVLEDDEPEPVTAAVIPRRPQRPSAPWRR